MTIDRSWIRVVFLIFFMIEDLSVKNKMNSIISLYYCQRIVLVLTILRERKSHRSISRLDYEINR